MAAFAAAGGESVAVWSASAGADVSAVGWLAVVVPADAEGGSGDAWRAFAGTELSGVGWLAAVVPAAVGGESVEVVDVWGASAWTVVSVGWLAIVVPAAVGAVSVEDSVVIEVAACEGGAAVAALD